MDTDSIFTNKRLVQISFGQYDLSLNFHDGLSLMISDSLYVISKHNKAHWTCDSQYANIEEFFAFLNKAVTQVFFNESDGLTIQFDGGTFNIPRPGNDFEYLHVISKDHGVYIY